MPVKRHRSEASRTLIGPRRCATVAAGVAMLGFVARVRAIMLTPHTEWVAIEREAGANSALLTRYLAILAAIPALARFIGGSLIGGYTPILSGLMQAVIGYVLTFALVYGVALVANALAPKFDTAKDFSRALRLTGYAYTPLWLAGVFLAVPGLSFLSILGLYGAYLLWVGLPVMMRTPASKALPYAAAIAATAFLFEILLRTVLATI